MGFTSEKEETCEIIHPRDLNLKSLNVKGLSNIWAFPLIVLLKVSFFIPPYLNISCRESIRISMQVRFFLFKHVILRINFPR